MTTEKEQTTNTDKAIEPGDLTKLLEEYRGIAQLDVHQMADTLCLTPTAIKSLESEAFDKLPEPPYVRGYLRNYSRLADQDPKHITRVYDILRGATPDVDNENMGVNLTASSSYQDVANPLITPQRFRLALLAGLLLLLGFLTMIPGVRSWTANVWSNFSTPSKTENIAETDTGTDTQNVLNLPSITDDVPGNLPISPDETEEMVNNTETTDTTADAPEQEEKTSNLSTENSPVSDSEQASDSGAENDTNKDKSADDSTAATDSATTNENNEDQEQASAAEQDEGNTNLKFVFAKEVWLRINGEDGSVVYEALHPAGTEKTLSLNSPLKLKVGNAEAMQLFVNGIEMDTTEYTRGSVAKFGIE